MLKLFFFSISLSCLLAACNSSTDKKKVVKENSDTSIEQINQASKLRTDSLKDTLHQEKIDLKAFWEAKVVPIIEHDALLNQQIFHFPIEGDWGYMIDLNKHDSLWTDTDFIKKYGLLFTDDVINQLKNQTYRDVDIVHANGETELLISVAWKSINNPSHEESGMILRYRKRNGIWMLCVIQAVG